MVHGTALLMRIEQYKKAPKGAFYILGKCICTRDIHFNVLWVYHQ